MLKKLLDLFGDSGIVVTVHHNDGYHVTDYLFKRGENFVVYNTDFNSEMVFKIMVDQYSNMDIFLK